MNNNANKKEKNLENSKTNLKKIPNKKYDTVKSKVGLLLKAKTQNQEEAKKTKLNLNNEKTALKTKKAEIKSSVVTNKKSSSVPIKDKKADALKNNNILNKVKKFTAESSLKKLFSENPLLKNFKNKSTNDKNINVKNVKGKLETSTAKKSQEANQQENENEYVLMSIEKNELLSDSSKKNKSASQVNKIIN